MRKWMIVPVAVLYLSVIFYFAFRPFRPIFGLQYAPAEIGFKDGAVHVQRDAAIESRRDVQRVRDALMQSGQMSLELLLQTDSLKQGAIGNVFGLARDAENRDFTVGQVGPGLVFRMRTSETDFAGIRGRMVVPQVFDPQKKQHLLLTYDGSTTRLYVDGLLNAESTDLQGDFSNWGRNHIFGFGDLPPGGHGWAGQIWRTAVYDRALDATEAQQLFNQQGAIEPVAAYEFGSGQLPKGLKKLRYRNLFITTDPAAYDLDDCLFNVAAFVPLGILVYLALPLRLERRKIVAAIVIPMLVGLLASGTIEFFQCFILTRVPCLPDLIYNATGALMGGLFGWLYYSSFENKTNDRSIS